MPSNTSLYTSNANTGTVASINYTTLYASQGSYNAGKNYGNANVEAFLNAGTDGGNTVLNIKMAGSLTVGGESNLGPVGNVTITGGNAGYVLGTDGTGNLAWVQQANGNGVPYIHFDVTSNGNNQQFSNTLLTNYTSNNSINLFKNGVNIEPTLFEKTNANTVQINIDLQTGDTIDILASSGGGGLPAGNATEVQFNSGFSFASSNAFTFDVSNTRLSVTNANITSANTNTIRNRTYANIEIINQKAPIIGYNVNNLQANGTQLVMQYTPGPNSNPAVANITSGYTIGNSTVTSVYLDGTFNTVDIDNPIFIEEAFYNFFEPASTGTPTWKFSNIGNITLPFANSSINYPNGIPYGTTAGNGTPGAPLNSIQFNNGGNFGGDSNFTFDAANNIVNLETINLGANINSANFNYYNGQGIGFYPTGAMFIDASSASGTVDIIGDVRFNNAVTTSTKTLQLGDVNYVKLTGGTLDQVLKTDGNGNLSFTSAIANANFASNSNYATNANYATFAGDSNVANIAYSVDVGNVNGIGNIATINLDGNASNILYGNGVFSGISIGNIASANYANYAGDVVNAAQGNITSLGTLSGLNVSGNVSVSANVTANYFIGNGSALTSITGGNVTGTVANANYASYAGNVVDAIQSNITSLGTLSSLTATGNITSSANVTASYFIGNGSQLTSITGANVTGTVADANYAAYAGNVTIAGQGNITSVGTLTSLNVSGNITTSNLTVNTNLTSLGNLTIQRGFESFVTNATGATGTINFDVITQSILFHTGNATANCTVNVRGNSTITLDTLLSSNQSLTIVFLNKVGATAYINNTFQIDGSTQTVNWVNAASPGSTTLLTSANQSYAYTIMKTGANTYTVLGSLTEYK